MAIFLTLCLAGEAFLLYVLVQFIQQLRRSPSSSGSSACASSPKPAHRCVGSSRTESLVRFRQSTGGRRSMRQRHGELTKYK